MAFFNAEHKNIRTVALQQWLHWAGGHAPQQLQVALPMIQRGFVWKPHQIIELWDTLLQDMPIGALLISEMAPDAHAIALGAERQRIDTRSPGERLALVDGQQRTLAMLTGWPLPPGTAYTHRLWVDFADTPRNGERLRLRVTTRNQPFGFQRDSANSKLSQAVRRAAKQAWLQTPAGAAAADNTLPDFAHTTPYHAQATLALDMRQLVQWWQDNAGDAAAWSQQVLQALQTQPIPAQKLDAVTTRIATLATGLAHVHAADVALLRVAPDFFATATASDATTTEDTDPPLALLFKRLGSNATLLSDDDYVYAILKHLQPSVHDLVNDLHGQHNAHRASAASLLSATGLVMSALRLAAAHYNAHLSPAQSQPVPDPENPNKQEFHRLIRHAGFLDNAFLPLLQTGGPMRQWFDRVLACLDYLPASANAIAAPHDAGLPRHALPQLPRALVQVLLRLAQIGYLGTETAPLCPERRSDVLRLVLHWWVCVHEQHKASRLTYQTIAQAVAETETETPSESAPISSNQLGQRIAQSLVDKNLAHALPTPQAIADCPACCQRSYRAKTANAQCRAGPVLMLRCMAISVGHCANFGCAGAPRAATATRCCCGCSAATSPACPATRCPGAMRTPPTTTTTSCRPHTGLTGRVRRKTNCAWWTTAKNTKSLPTASATSAFGTAATTAAMATPPRPTSWRWCLSTARSKTAPKKTPTPAPIAYSNERNCCKTAP